MRSSKQQTPIESFHSNRSVPFRFFCRNHRGKIGMRLLDMKKIDYRAPMGSSSRDLVSLLGFLY